MIFLSHNSNDKPVAEPIAIRLAQIYGQDRVFYDSWSVQPGDGIIDKMENGLSDCKFFFFFVSANSLNSRMVRMEWQNTIMRAARSDVKLIPVILDSSTVPTLLLQTLYIDLFRNGMEVALRQMVDVINGVNTFRQISAGFSNLDFTVTDRGTDHIVEINALYYMEPVSSFMIMAKNDSPELNVVSMESGLSHTSTFGDIRLEQLSGNGWSIGRDKATVPGFPYRIRITPVRGSVLKLQAVLHQTSESQWLPIPRRRS